MEKKKYNTPAIERVEFDNEISLALASLPVNGPGETMIDVKFRSPFMDVDGLA